MSATVTGALLLTGCGGGQKHNETMREKQFGKWNLTRIGILYQLAEQQYKVGDYDKCQESLKDAFALKLDYAPIHILAAKVHIEKANLELALEQLNKAIQIKPSEPEPYYLLGVLYQRWQKPEVACDYYRQAWTRKQDEARYMLATVEMEISLGRLDEAQSILESKMVYFEQSAALRVALARIATLKNDFPTAAKCYRDAVTLMPDDHNLRRSFADTLFYAKQYKEAAQILEDLKKRADTTDRPNLMTMLGQSYMHLRRHQDARNCFQEVVRDRPDDLNAYLNLGKACVQTGDLGISLSAARKILRSEPDNVQAMIVMALVQQKQKKWNDASVTLNKAARVAPQDTTVLCMLGVNAQQQGKKSEAVAWYEKAVRVNPSDAWAVELLGRAKPAVSQEAPAAPDNGDEVPVPAANIPMPSPVS
jgi:tetratricopeptide (TPR) repeat protein